MGTARNEVSGFRKAGDHPAGRAIPSAGGRTLEQLGVSRATFYRWCDLYQTGGPEALEDRSPRTDRISKRIPDNVRGQIMQLACHQPEVSPREQCSGLPQYSVPRSVRTRLSLPSFSSKNGTTDRSGD